MQEAMTWYLRTAAGLGTKASQRAGNGRRPEASLYRSKGDGPNDYIFIFAATESMWERMCETMGRRDLFEDPRFAGRPERIENQAELKKEITAWTVQHDKYSAMIELCENDVPACAVLDTKDLFENPHLLKRGFVNEIEHPELGNITILGWAPRMSESYVRLKVAP